MFWSLQRQRQPFFSNIQKLTSMFPPKKKASPPPKKGRVHWIQVLLKNRHPNISPHQWNWSSRSLWSATLAAANWYFIPFWAIKPENELFYFSAPWTFVASSHSHTQKKWVSRYINFSALKDEVHHKILCGFEISLLLVQLRSPSCRWSCFGWCFSNTEKQKRSLPNIVGGAGAAWMCQDMNKLA